MGEQGPEDGEVAWGVRGVVGDGEVAFDELGSGKGAGCGMPVLMGGGAEAVGKSGRVVLGAARGKRGVGDALTFWRAMTIGAARAL